MYNNEEDNAQSVTGPKRFAPKQEGELPEMQKFEVSFHFKGRVLGSITVEARDKNDAVRVASEQMDIGVKKAYY